MSQLAWFLGVAPGGILPAMRFFVPRAKFVRYMAANYKGKLLYDIGAGVGHVARALADSGLDVMALDLYRREEEQFPSTIADATSYAYKADSVLMFCRPSHEGFVEQTIETALQCGVREIIYVGLAKNRRQDLGVYSRWFRRLLRDVGAARENVYQFDRGGHYENVR
jgi:uncharacterized UPF0146 family protein